MFKIILALCLMVVSLQSVAQQPNRYTISGKLVNGQGEALPGATVMLLNASDSVLMTFGSTRNNGEFLLKTGEKGGCILQITYIGYQTWSKAIELGALADVSLGTVEMQERLEELQEVEVVGEYVPVQIKKDTIQYNADAFRTQPNDVVEELLKKLPGVEVETDGTIKAQGEEVERLTVDGKDFFGGDPKTATRNLPADAIDKVKVFDAMSEMATFSGIDDGERTKTIDLTLKEDRKNGFFGTAEAGYGTDDRYSGKLSLNRFTKKSQFSVLGMANNVNQQGFSVQEFVDFSGGMQALARGGGRRMAIGGNNAAVPVSNGLSNGDVQTLAGGINWNIDISKNTDLRTSYFINSIDNEIRQEVDRENFLPNGESFFTNEDQFQDTEGNNHRLNTTLRHRIDSTQNIQVTANVRYNDGSYQSVLESIQELSLANTENETTSSSANINSNIIYRKKFNKPGRVLSAQATFQYGDQEQQADLYSLIFIPETQGIRELDQIRDLNDETISYGGRLSYMEPIGGGKYIEGNYRRRYVLDDNGTDAFDVEDDQLIPNEPLTNSFERLFTYDIGGLNFRWNTNFMSLTAGADVQHSQLEGKVLGDEVNDRAFTNLLPSLTARFTLASSKNLMFDYRTSFSAPTLEQLQPVPDNSDPQNIYIGNPDLKPAYTHRVNVRFMSFSQFSYTSIFANLTGSITNDRIINARTIDRFQRQTTTPINIDTEGSVNAYAYFGTPIRRINSQVSFTLNGRYTNSQTFVNNELADLDRWTQSFGFNLSNRNIDVVEWAIGTRLTRTNTIYDVEGLDNQVFWNQQYTASLNINFLKSWSIDHRFTYSRLTGDAFEETQDLPLLSLTLSRFIFKDKKGQIKLTAFDLLNQNKGISRNADVNFIEDVRTNSLGRYFMLSFLYAVRGFGTQGPGRGGGIRRMRG